MANLVKDPDAHVDFGFDWSQWLKAGDTISSSEWILDPANTDEDLEIENDTHTASGTVVFVTGGTVGVSYSITNRIETADGLKDDRTLTILVKER